MIALTVELSQLAHPAWLVAFRHWPGVGLVIGYDFVPIDLACYAVGIGLGAAIDWRVARPPSRERSTQGIT